MEFFKAKSLSPHITQIEDATGVFCFLVQGSERAVLVDTGTGVGDLPAFVAALTDLPLTVICTHGHVDHAGGASLFKEVYLAPADWELATRPGTAQMQADYAALMMGEAAKQLTPQDLAPVRTAPFLPLKDGALFPLGGVSVQAVALPGHTQGMTCILIPEERSVIMGDACNTRVFLFDSDACPVSEYRQNLLDFQAAHGSRYDTVYLSHAFDTVPKTVLEDCVELCGEILVESDDHIPFSFMGQQKYMAKAAGPDGLRLDGKIGNIVYDPQRLR